MKPVPIPPCPHGVGFIEILNMVEADYQRELATGERKRGWLCSCCMAPAGDETRCPSCIAEVTE